MNPTKQAFGQFVTVKRKAAGLTQRELADRLFVTESAVSKWERGMSYPDITLVSALSRDLGVSERELINASEDEAGRRIERQARGYRRWMSAILWTTLLAYAATLLTCFTVDLSVEHTLTWFWIVLTAVAAAFSLTTLPLLVRPRGWSALGAFVLSIVALLIVVWLLTGLGGWLPIPISAVLLTVVLVFAPIWLARVPLPAPASRHRTVIVLGLDTVALLVFLLVVMLAAGGIAEWGTNALPTALIALVIPWGAALVIRYLPIAGLYRAAIVVAYIAVYSTVLLQPAIAWVNHENQPRPIDLSRWNDAYISGNVAVLTLAGSLLVAAILAVTAALRRSAPAQTT